jgi:hypothetical protein
MTRESELGVSEKPKIFSLPLGRHRLCAPPPPPPVYYSMGIGGCSTARKVARGWNLPINLNLVAKLRICETLPPFPHMSSLRVVQGQFYFICSVLRVLCWPVWLQEFEAPRISRHPVREDGRVVSPTHRLLLPPQKIPLILISVRAWVQPGAIVQPEGSSQWKIPMTPSGIELATFRIVAQRLDQLRHRTFCINTRLLHVAVQGWIVLCCIRQIPSSKVGLLTGCIDCLMAFHNPPMQMQWKHVKLSQWTLLPTPLQIRCLLAIYHSTLHCLSYWQRN